MKRYKRTVKPECKAHFIELSNAFVTYHGSLGNCFNYNNMNYKTTCSCLFSLCDGPNADVKIGQVTEAIYEFFSRPKNTQKLVVKDWI